MMAAGYVSRRGFVDLAGLAGVAVLAPGSVLADAGTWPDRPPMRALALWLRSRPDGAVVGTIGASVGSDGAAAWRSLGEPVRLVDRSVQGESDPMWSWEARRRAFAAGRQALMTVAARGWGVPARECRCEAGRIRHPGTDRELGYRIWAAVA
ncbi:MAG: hypothetical protein ACJ8H8_05760 [Geminicoccaceae bacterium]